MTQQQADTYREDVRKEYNMLVQRATAANTVNIHSLLSNDVIERK